jgi:Kef-type K+ transport system membrane component KefB
LAISRATGGILEILLHLLVLLLVTRAFGEAAERLGQSASVGELLAGVMLALAVGLWGDDIAFLATMGSSEALNLVASLGIFFLMLLAGVELEPKEMAGASGGAFLVALGGMVVPLGAGFLIGWYLLPENALRDAQALVIGVAMAITAVPATVKVFAEFGLLHTRLGETVVSAALFDDIFGLVLLALVTAIIQTDSIPDPMALIWLLVKVTGFFAITIVLGVHVYPKVSRRLQAAQVAALEFSALVMVALAYGALAEALGMHWIMGAFMAGLFFEPSRVGQAAYDNMKIITTAISGGVLGPLFFAHIGLQVDLSAVLAVPLFVILLILVAFLGKLVGAGVPALWIGLQRPEALMVGVGMASRGAVELVVLSIVLEAGVFRQSGNGEPLVTHLFSALVIMAVVNTLLSPLLLRGLSKRRKPSQ